MTRKHAGRLLKRLCVVSVCVGHPGLTTGDFGWGSPTFAKMGRKKINLISLFLKLDVQVGCTASKQAGGSCGATEVKV